MWQWKCLRSIFLLTNQDPTWHQYDVWGNWGGYWPTGQGSLSSSFTMLWLKSTVLKQSSPWSIRCNHRNPHQPSPTPLSYRPGFLGLLYMNVKKTALKHYACCVLCWRWGIFKIVSAVVILKAFGWSKQVWLSLYLRWKAIHTLRKVAGIWFFIRACRR